MWLDPKSKLWSCDDLPILCYQCSACTKSLCHLLMMTSKSQRSFDSSLAFIIILAWYHSRLCLSSVGYIATGSKQWLLPTPELALLCYLNLILRLMQIFSGLHHCTCQALPRSIIWIFGPHCGHSWAQIYMTAWFDSGSCLWWNFLIDLALALRLSGACQLLL